MVEYSSSMKRLIEALKRLPGIGPKSAQRLAFYVLESTNVEITELLSSISEAKANIKNCSECFNITDTDPCNICSDSSRDHEIICVVESTKDLMAIERSGAFKGLYHILGGAISPLDGISPETLTIKELLHRIRVHNIKEL